MRDKDILNIKNCKIQTFKNGVNYKIGEKISYDGMVYEVIKDWNGSIVTTATPYISTDYFRPFISNNEKRYRLKYNLTGNTSCFQNVTDQTTSNSHYISGYIIGYTSVSTLDTNTTNIEYPTFNSNGTIKFPSGLWNISAYWSTADLSDTQPANYSIIEGKYGSSNSFIKVSSSGYYSEAVNMDRWQSSSLIPDFVFRSTADSSYGLITGLRITVGARFCTTSTVNLHLIIERLGD